MQSQYRIFKVGIPKRTNSEKDCPECHGRSQKRHIHKEDLYKPTKQMYWQVRADRRDHYKKAMIATMKDIWFKYKLEPQEEILFHDGKFSFEAVSLCKPKSVFGIIKGLVEPKLTPEDARKILLDQLNQWNLTPTEETTNESPEIIIPKA